MLRKLALMLPLMLAAGLMLVGGVCACSGQSGFMEPASAAQDVSKTASNDDCCCECDKQDDERPDDKSPCDCGSPACPMTSGDEPSAAASPELALVSDREFEFDELAPKFKALVVAWFAESLQRASADVQLASTAYISPPPDSHPTFLTLQVLLI